MRTTFKSNLPDSMKNSPRRDPVMIARNMFLSQEFLPGEKSPFMKKLTENKSSQKISFKINTINNYDNNSESNKYTTCLSNKNLSKQKNSNYYSLNTSLEESD